MRRCYVKGSYNYRETIVAKDITKALGGFEEKKKGEYYESDDFICTYAVGHILTLFAPEDIDSKYKRWKLQDLPIIPEKFNMKPTPGQKGRMLRL